MPDETIINQESVDSGVNMGSSTPDAPPEAPEAPADVSIPEVVNNTTPENTENKAEMTENEQNKENTLENQAPGIEPNPEPVSEPISEPVQTPEPVDSTGSPQVTAQIPGNEPLNQQPEPIRPEPVPVIVPNKNKVLELLNKAKLAIQSRKRKKLDKIMTLFLKKQKITNKDVGEFLHVSDATATRYLDILEKENKIKQVGKTGKAVSYQKI